MDSGDNIRTQEIINSQSFSEVLPYAEGYELIAIDEAQQIKNIGMGLKILVDKLRTCLSVVRDIFFKYIDKEKSYRSKGLFHRRISPDKSGFTCFRKSKQFNNTFESTEAIFEERI